MTTAAEDNAIVEKGQTSWEALMPDCCLACHQLGTAHRRTLWWAGFIGCMIGSACASIGKPAVKKIMDNITAHIIDKLPDK